jgi:hypothetical protein
MNTYYAFALGWLTCAVVFWIGGFVGWVVL